MTDIDVLAAVMRETREILDELNPSATEESPFHLTDGDVAGADRGSFDERFRARRVDLFDRLEHGIPEIDYLPASDRMLVRGKRHLLPAPKKIGKSISTLRHGVDMVLAGARIVILDRENGADLYAARLGQIIAAIGLDDDERAQLQAGLAYYEFPRLRDYDRDELLADLTGADLVIFDGQRRFLTDLGLDEDKSGDYAKFMGALVDPLFDAGIATLILDNTGHGDQTRGRGSSAKADLNEISFILETVDPYSTSRVGKIRLRLEPGSSRFGNEGTWDMTIGAGVFGGWELVSLDDLAATEHQERHDTALDWIVAYVNEHPGPSKTTVEEAFQEHHGRGGRVLARTVIEGALTASKTASTPTLAVGPGKSPNGIYLYPASTLNSPLAEPETASTASTSSGPTREEYSPTRRRFNKAASTASTSEGTPDQVEIDRLLEKFPDLAGGDP